MQPPEARDLDATKYDDVPLASDKSSKRVLLYGTLDIWIKEAKCLPNMDLFSEKITQCFSILSVCRKPSTKAKEDIRHHSRNKITSDPYVSLDLGSAVLMRTRVISNSQDPKWDERFRVHVAHFVSEVVLLVKDDDVFGAQLIGKVKLPAEKISCGEPLDGWFDILGSGGKPCNAGAQLNLCIKFTSVEQDGHYTDGVDDKGVPNTYFPLRKGGNIVLYQDAHVPDGTLPDIELDGRKCFKHGKCWEEICTAILEAHHLVYIAGWSVYDKVKLVREPNSNILEGGQSTLGELLKRKSAEGVRVLLLLWDDKTSHHTPFFNFEGVMGVHDEETRKFFKHSSVRCVLSPRYGDNKLSWVKQKIVGTMYTHHQKMVIVDSQGPGNCRKLTAFLGGLDLCDGRYDTPRHPLFSTLDTVHRDDYHNPTLTGSVASGGPRQPWHDLHCKIDGPAAYDVLTNFEQRWRKSTRWHRHTESLIEINRISWILSQNQGEAALMVTQEDDPETWHVQVGFYNDLLSIMCWVVIFNRKVCIYYSLVFGLRACIFKIQRFFRSIDSGSVRGFPRRVSEAVKQNLVCGKNITIDMSIQTAYVERIRAAQHFIYIENQYFLGSSYAWEGYKEAGAIHLIPMELALKIASKIRSGQRFSVYIVIPMWPEGVPDSQSVQEILYFQGKTMQMMYSIIADALQDVGLSDKCHPKDYLNFYCLGNREAKDPTEPNPVTPPTEKSKQWLAQKNRRFMIYVHSKGIIVDDEYVLIGSANINQRSMDGSRDTEIAMGTYQPHYTWARKRKHPHGQVYGYRMSLWSEHLGCVEDLFADPSSIDCVHRVNDIAEGLWQQFVAEDPTTMRGHLLPYPIKVETNGMVGPLPGHVTFPDVGGKVLGTSYSNMPDDLTT